MTVPKANPPTAPDAGPPPAAAAANAGPPPAEATTPDAARPPAAATEHDAGPPPAAVLDPDAHPVLGLDDVVHQRVRLGILTIAHEARRVEFGYLCSRLELTAGNLSKHLTVLETAGLVGVEKGYEGKRGRTWITLTKAGTAALAAEISRLRALIDRVEFTPDGL